eukprot:g939.t1
MALLPSREEGEGPGEMSVAVTVGKRSHESDAALTVGEGKDPVADPWDYSHVVAAPRRYADMTKNVPDPPRCCCPTTRIGHMHVCVEGPRARDHLDIKCMVGPCWPMMILTFTLIGGISLGCYVYFLPRIHWAFTIPACLSLIAVLVALQRTACVNPGIVPRTATPPNDRWRWHELAQTYLPSNAHVCEDTCVAAEDVDHFCPWTGTLIAKGNIKCFQIFNALLGLQFCMVVAVVLIFVFTRNEAGQG